MSDPTGPMSDDEMDAMWIEADSDLYVYTRAVLAREGERLIAMCHRYDDPEVRRMFGVKNGKS